jgi:hypothetical protein
MKEKTAIEYLFVKLYDFVHEANRQAFINILAECKELEKQQIIDAHIEGQLMFNNANKYYNETFK